MIRKLIHFLRNLFKKKSKIRSMKNYNKEVDRLLELDEMELKISE